MHKVFFTVGPSALYPTVPAHLKQALKENIPSISHRSETFRSLFSAATSGLRKVLGVPDSHAIFFLGSATEGMERIIENCVARHSFHFVNGDFSKKFFLISQALRKEPEKHEVPPGEGFAFAAAVVPAHVELICFTQNETNTGIALDPQDIASIHRRYPEKLIAVDIASSAPYLLFDYTSVDCVFFSVQKGFGLPAGLGVLIVGPRAMDKAKKLESEKYNIGTYHNFLSLSKSAVVNETPETPNVLGVYLLGKVCVDMITRGIASIRSETDEKSALLYEFFDRDGRFSCFVRDPRVRSKTVLVINTSDSSASVIESLKKLGFVVSSGYKQRKESQIRIGNFPAHSVADVQKLLHNLSKI